MGTHTKEDLIAYAPAEDVELYPDSDGKPMAVSDLHRRILTRTIEVLDTYFQDRPEVYVSGDIMMYYVQGNPQKSVSPDVLVAFGLGKKLRRTYLVWNEGKVPDFAMEFSSESTYRNDLGHKMQLYASLGIQDYFLYDAEDLYLPSPLMGFTLVDGAYTPISEDSDGGLHSGALGLDFHVSAAGLGIYDPVADKWLQTPAESAAARAELAETRAQQEAQRAQQEIQRAKNAETRAQQEIQRAENAETRAQQETQRAENAEAEIARLREALARLQTDGM